jgi:hypothetical protein
MGYESVMQSEVLALMRYFRAHVKDIDLHDRVLELIADKGQWNRAHGMFDHVRSQLLKNQDSLLHGGSSESHYLFLEVCLKTFYNEIHTDAPFDSCSPYWIIKNAFCLARDLKIPFETVVEIVSPARTSME